jgi:hypothetical protein
MHEAIVRRRATVCGSAPDQWLAGPLGTGLTDCRTALVHDLDSADCTESRD